MTRKILFLGLAAAFMLAGLAYAEGDIVLPTPNMKGGKPLMEVLKDRRTDRSFDPRPLSPQVLADLLWATDGINRPETGMRTAPTAKNCQEIEIYVALESGLYLYDPGRNILVKVSGDDIRAATGLQPFVKDAPVNLIFVLDEKKGASLGNRMDFYAACDTGYISQNVYLFSASEGLATVARGWFDEKALSKAMNLPSGKRVILTQTVGYKI